MKRILLSLLASVLMAAGINAQQFPAFPGAEGYGRHTTGGRGGKVIHVTNLNNSGEGSLRAAVAGDDPKIVVFDVGGIIALSSDLNIGSNTTIAGQTAPGEGITVRYYTINPNGNNIIIRFIRFRRGEEKDINDGADACWTRQKTNIMLDHCSFSWSIDEVASFYDNKNFTMQWCTIAEALHNPGHSKGQHGYGGIWGGKGASFHHNFLCHMDNRMPRFNGARYSWEGYDKSEFANTVMAERVDFRNCLMYNWGNGGCYGGPGGGFINMVNNYYKAGPATKTKNRVTTCTLSASGNSDSSHPELYGLYSRYFINGNFVDGYGANYDWEGVVTDNGRFTCTDTYGFYGEGEGATINIKLAEEVEMAAVTTHSAETVYEKLPLYAGASLTPDAQDIRYSVELAEGTAQYTGSVTGKGGLIDLVSDQGGYSLSSAARPSYFDTDNDGMPDEWENSNGLNPTDASDATAYTVDNKKKVYTNVEVYINSLVQDIMIEENEDAIEGKEVRHYFPAYHKQDGTFVQAINPDLYPDYVIQTGDATITWSMANASDPTAAAASENLMPVLVGTTVDKASIFSWGSVKTQGGKKLIEVAPSEGDSGANKNHSLKFSYEIAEGTLFQPTAVSFNISRNGTNKGSFSVYWENEKGEETELDEALDMVRNSESPYYLAYNKNLIGYEASRKGTLIIAPYNIDADNSKKFGLGSVVISGIISDASAINGVQSSQEITIEYHNLQGVKVGNDHRGVVLQTVKYADGTKKVTKLIR